MTEFASSDVEDAVVTAPIPLPLSAPPPSHGMPPDVKATTAGTTSNRRLPLLLIAGGVVLVLAAVLSYRHGIATNLFPAYLADGAPTPIRRYSAPWIGGAGGLIILAGLLLTQGISRLVHYKL